MDTTDILNAITAIVEEVLGVDPAEVSAATSFTDDLDIDSLAMMEIAVAVEDRFEVRIPDDRVRELRTIGDAVTYVADRRS
ncbi:acyl carrier protein [Kitasatospora brasiliensis]|uniref:acyl carrier protein n=1 Tax=Kitasatospora brasiliensis TaxID=3058040 RepID=UPI002930B726|nr:acyl carrier protein [Kitasatospora sp. K002]